MSAPDGSHPETNSSALTATRSSIKAALEGLFTGDAVAMPVHWYYRPADILRQFPPSGIQRMEPAPEHHPSSIMSLHSTRAAGRSAASRGRAQAPQIVGDVILRGREQHWGVPGTHYHHGMPAGENTLNAWCARWLIEQLTEAGDYDAESWFTRYVERMTAESPAHPDTYAESWHRGFFANKVRGLPLLECGAVSHDTPSMGALVTLLPVALALLPQHPLKEVQAICRRHVGITHPDDTLREVVSACVQLLDELLHIAADDGLGEEDRHAAQQHALITAATAIPGTRLDKLLERADKGRMSDPEVVGGRYSLACYIEDSWPSVLWLAARHGRTPGKALLINANLGGENAHRGSVLGALSGLMSGRTDEGLVSQLHRRDEIAGVIEGFVGRFVG